MTFFHHANFGRFSSGFTLADRAGRVEEDCAARLSLDVPQATPNPAPVRKARSDLSAK